MRNSFTKDRLKDTHTLKWFKRFQSKVKLEVEHGWWSANLEAFSAIFRIRWFKRPLLQGHSRDI